MTVAMICISCTLPSRCIEFLTGLPGLEKFPTSFEGRGTSLDAISVHLRDALRHGIPFRLIFALLCAHDVICTDHLRARTRVSNVGDAVQD